jgi:deoxyinosine 3'endonuclease (endonuclease V)
VAYQDDVARGACVLAEGWTSQFPLRSFCALRTPIEDYVPGQFWRRELPVLLGLLEGVAADVIVVDGYVWLDDAGRKGLGAHLYDSLGIPVVGVAKTAFDGSGFAQKVIRGASRNPLYVTAVGIGAEEAAAAVVSMHGGYRMPTLLTMADRLARYGEQSRT